MNIQVYFSNISEDVWDFIESMPPKAKKFEIAENLIFSDRGLLTNINSHHTIFISPIKIDPIFLRYYKQLFNRKNLQVWVPEKHSGQVCLDFLNDKKLFSQLEKLGQQHHLVLKSYSASRPFFQVVNKLKAANIEITTPESPDYQAAWTPDFFGSKIGIRQAVTSLQSRTKPWMSKGVITHGLKNIVDIAADWYCRYHGVVIKTQKGHAGEGVLIFKPNDLPQDLIRCKQAISQRLETESYWKIFPAVIERYLEIDTSVGGGNPNVELKITKNRKVKLLYFCGMRITSKGVFFGIEIGHQVLPADVKKKIANYSRKLGKIYATNGYRGYFEVDCIYTKNKKLIVTESNVRSTGGTHVYHAARMICGKNFRNQYIVSNNKYPLPVKKKVTFSQVLKTLNPILFSKSTQEGLILAGANVLKQYNLAYIIIGKDQASATAIEKKMEKLLKLL